MPVAYAAASVSNCGPQETATALIPTVKRPDSPDATSVSIASGGVAPNATSRQKSADDRWRLLSGAPVCPSTSGIATADTPSLAVVAASASSPGRTASITSGTYAPTPAGTAARTSATDPRAITRSIASESSMAPDAQAAAQSPTPRPVICSGTTPHERHISASPYCPAKLPANRSRAGRSISCAPSPSSANHPASGWLMRPARSASHRSTTARNTGWESYKSPGRTPGSSSPNENRTGTAASGARPRTPRAGSSPAAIDSRAAAASAPSPTTTAARTGKRARQVLAESATSDISSDGCRLTCTAHLAASSASARSSFADNVSACSGLRANRGSSDRTGAASSTTCALVPLNPNELTPAIRRAYPAGHGSRRVGISTPGRCSSAMSGFNLVKCRCAGISPCCERQGRLHHARDAGAGFEVPHVGLHRADGERAIRRAPCSQHGIERLQLDRVAERGPGPMRLDVPDFVGRDAGVEERVAHDGLLRGTVRHRQPAAAAVLIHCRASHQRDDPIAGGERVRQPLQHDDATPLAPDVAVGCCVEGLAAPVGARASWPARSSP